jgi:hypothetical protein
VIYRFEVADFLARDRDLPPVSNETWFVMMFASAAMAMLYGQLKVVLSALAWVSSRAVRFVRRDAGLSVLTRPAWFIERDGVMGSLLPTHPSAMPIVLSFSPRRYWQFKLHLVLFAPVRPNRIFPPLVLTTPQSMDMPLSVSRCIAETHDRRMWATPDFPYGVVAQLTLQQAGDQND